MSSHFDRIEQRLQAVIENSLNRLPWRSQQPRLAASLAAAVRTQLELDEHRDDPLPDCFNLFMNSENCKSWEAHPEWSDWMNRILGDLAVEAGRSFSRQPEIRILPDPDLDANNVRVVLTYQEVDVSSTAVITTDADPLDIHRTNGWTGPYLMIENGDSFPLRQSVTNIGRREDNDLVLSDPRISREHAQIRVIHGESILFDLNSTGGTFVNGERITSHTLRPGDVISLAGTSLIFGQDLPPQPRTSGTTPAQFTT